MKSLFLLLPLLMLPACTSSKVWLIERNKETEVLECWTWGQATCSIADPEDGSIIMTAESKGLSDNGVTVIVKSITQLPKVIIESIFPLGKVVEAVLPEDEEE